jgi:hypothetical protein
MLAHGEWPDKHVDHINGVKTDNRIANLRLATASQNQCNRGVQKRTKSGFKGVYPVAGSSTWFVKIMLRGESRYLGTFPTPQLAADAYAAAAAEWHGEFARAA